MAMSIRAAPGQPGIPTNFPILLSNEMRIIEPAFAYLLEQAQLHAHSAETVRTYGEQLYDWFDSLEQSGLDWRGVDEATIAAYRNRMLEAPSPHTGRPYARSTINDRVRSVCRFYAWAHRPRMIDELPFSFRDAPAVRPKAMGFLAHDRAFAFFKGACRRGIYDNMKTAVETIFVGKERAYNRRFVQMCGHYLVDPVACTPASGWEKGQVENQVGVVRERFFTPRLRVKSYDELNGWLLDQCVAYAKAHPHPEFKDRTVWQAFEAERPSLVPYGGRFDGFHAVPASVSKTCLVRFDNNKYSVQASAVGRPVEVRAYAERIELRQDGRIVGEHRRSFGRDKAVFDPWHYVPVLARKPGALRNGAPFKDWVLPSGLERVRRKLIGVGDGDRQMVAILTTVLSDGLPAVEAACNEALLENVHSADVILNILARRRETVVPITIMTPDALQLRHEPVADCARYDSLRRAV